MSFETWLAFAAASAVLLVIPGPTILTVTFVVLATVNAALYAVFAASARRALATPMAQRRFNVAGGVLLTAAGTWALFARRGGADA